MRPDAFDGDSGEDLRHQGHPGNLFSCCFGPFLVGSESFPDTLVLAAFRGLGFHWPDHVYVRCDCEPKPV